LGATSLTGCVWEFGEDEYQDEYFDEDYRTPDPPSTPEEVCTVASNGGNGGRGGLLSIRTTNPAVVEGSLATDGGRPGEAGVSAVGPEANVGTAGEAGSLELLEDPNFAFDLNWVQFEDWVAVGLTNSDDIIAVGGSDANPTIAVGKLEVGPGATLALSRYPTIYAYEVIVHEGGRLILRDNGESLLAVGEGSALEEPGLNGGSVALYAADMIVEGTVEVSGSVGDAGDDGGLGGHLRIKSESLYIGANGAIVVTGGAGGDGSDEQLCSADQPAP
jgi:hypothetical protein